MLKDVSRWLEMEQDLISIIRHVEVFYDNNEITFEEFDAVMAHLWRVRRLIKNFGGKKC